VIAILVRHRSLVFWSVLVGYGVLFLEIWVTLIPHGALRSSVLVAGSLVTLVPGLAVVFDIGGALQSLRAELTRRGYSGLTMSYPNYFWRSVGFALTILGVGVLYSGLAT
jgi:hypothetical protein